MPVYSIRFVYHIPNQDGTPGTDGPFEGVAVVRAGNTVGALLASKIVEAPGSVQITSVYPATPTSFN